MYLVEDLMTRELVTLKPEDDLSIAEKIMFLERVRHLPVVNARQRLVGLITHHDLLRIFAQRGHDKGTRAEEVMTTGVATVTPKTTLHRALKLMIRSKFGCLPVIDGEGVLVGLITEFDLVKFAAHFIRDLDEVEKVALDLRDGMAQAPPRR
jgi:CBS domain-containing protein